MLLRVGSLFLPGKLRIQNMQGSLASGVTFQELDYESQEESILLRDLKANWRFQIGSPFPVLIIEKLELNKASIRMTSESKQSENQELNYPVHLGFLKYFRLMQVELKEIQLIQNEKSVFSLMEFRVDPSEKNVYLLKIKGMLNRTRIEGAGKLSFKTGYPLIEEMNLHYGKAYLVLNGEVNHQLHLEAKLMVPQLETILPDMRGSLSLKGKLFGKLEEPQADIQILTRHFRYPDLIHIPQIEAKVKAAFTQGGSNITVSGVFASKNQLTAHFKLAPLSKIIDGSQAIAGEGRLSFLDLKVFNNWLINHPLGLSISQGKLTGEFQMGGRLNEPSISYALFLNNGDAFFKETGAHLHEVNISAHKVVKPEVELQGRFGLGEGSGELQGLIQPHFNDFSATLRLVGRDLKVYDTVEYQIIASPDLNVRLEKKRLFIQGSLEIPKAIIQSSDLNGGYALSSDVSVVDEHPSSNSGLYDHLAFAIKLILGDKVNVHYKSVNTQVKGSLSIISQASNPARVTGELYTVGGRYRAYGRQLEIQNGRFIYTGNFINNPGLDIRATQKIKTIVSADPSQMSTPLTDGSQSVGVLVRGTLNKPLVSLFSDPPGLSQGDILSYLIIGKPQSEASTGTSLAFLNAASSMIGGDDSEGLTDKIQNKLGLNDLSIGTTEYYNSTTGLSQNSTTANIGKNLGSKISVHYSVGLFDPVSIFSIRYHINKYLILQSETSSLENAGDLLYQIESAD